MKDKSWSECWNIVGAVENPCGQAEFTSMGTGNYYTIIQQEVDTQEPEDTVQNWLIWLEAELL